MPSTWDITTDGAPSIQDFLGARFRSTTMPAGAELFRQGDAAEVVYLLATGLAKLTRSGPSGKTALVALSGRGWIIGCSSAMLTIPYAVTATLLVKSQVYIIPGDGLQELVRTDARLSQWLVHMLSRESDYHLRQRADLAILRASTRLEQFLKRMIAASAADPPHGPVRLRLPIHLSELSQLLSVTPPYLSELLARLSARGVIERSDRDLVVLRPELLQQEEVS